MGVRHIPVRASGFYENDMAGIEAYSAHPAHLECVAVIKPLIAARACVDYTD